MDSIHLIRDNLIRSEEIVLSRIEDMREYCMVPPSSNGGCHTLWILGHLAYIEGLIIHQFMLGASNPLADRENMFDTDQVSTKKEDYVSFDRALSECRTQRAATVKLLDTFNESDLDRTSEQCPETAAQLFGTYRHCFQYVSDHWLMHRGQLANARSAAGIGRMWY